MTQRRSFWPGLLVGGALGVGLGLLLAPESGKDLRRRLRSWAGDMDQGVEDFLARTGQSAGELWTEVRSNLRVWTQVLRRRVPAKATVWRIRTVPDDSGALSEREVPPDLVSD